MIVELIAVFAILGGGSALVRLLGLRGWGVPVVGFTVGLALYIAVGTVQAMTPLSSSPVWTMALTGALPILIWTVARLKGRDVSVAVLPALTVSAGVVAVVLAFRSFNLLNWSYDSFRYVASGLLLTGDHFDSASTGLVPKRLLSVPLIHAPADLDGEFYLRSITPLIALAVLGMIAWIAWTGLKRTVDRQTLWVAIAVGLLLVVSVNRFTFHAFYLNGHLLFALLLLALAGASWLLAVDAPVDTRVLHVVIALAIPALIVTRAEAAMVIGPALLPLLLDERISLRTRSLFLAVLGSSVFAWQAFVITAYLRDGLSVPLSAYGPILIGVAALGVIPLLRWKLLTTQHVRVLWIAEGALWAMLLVLFLRHSQLLIDSAKATAVNVGSGVGGWGVSLMVLAVLAVAAIAFLAVPGQARLRFAITTFLPLVFLFAYFRDKAYRIGDGDSLNRMWIEILPIVVLYLVIAVSAGRRRATTLDDVQAHHPVVESPAP